MLHIVLGRDDLVLCSGTVRRASLETTASAAAQAGFQGVSVYHDEYLAALGAGASVVSLRRMFDDLGLSVAEFDGKMSWLPGDTEEPSVELFIDAAHAVGARSITVLELEGRRVGSDLAVEEVAEAYARVCDLAAAAGLLAHLEYFPLSGIADFATATAVAARADRPNGGVMVDTWHHLRGADRGRTDFGAAAAQVFAVQIGDVLATPMPEIRTEMMRHRQLPGTGVGDLQTILGALRAQGCTAPFGVEVYSEVLAVQDPYEVAQWAMASLRSVLPSESAGAAT